MDTRGLSVVCNTYLQRSAINARLFYRSYYIDLNCLIRQLHSKPAVCRQESAPQRISLGLFHNHTPGQPIIYENE